MRVQKMQKLNNSESIGNWRELISVRRFYLLLIWYLWVVRAACQDCDFPTSLAFTVTETDPGGTELFNVSSHNGSYSFTYTTQHGWLTEFLNLTLDDSDFYYRMLLNKPLDLEEIYYNLSVTDISGFTFTLHCKSQTDRRQDYHIIVEAVNEWPPEFNTTSIQLSVKETLPIRSLIINLTQWSSDKDVHPVSREIAGYSFLGYTGDSQTDGQVWLEMLIAYDGIVVVKKELDYETLPPDKKYVLLGVQVTDQGGKTGTASLTVHVEDDDDLPPMFNYPGCLQPCRVSYSVSVSPNFTGIVTGIKPAPIEAHDGDTLNYTIQYHIVQGTGDYVHYVNIDSVNGDLFISQELGEMGHSTLVLIVEAREVSQNARSTTSVLLISVQHKTQDETVIPSNADTDDTVIIVSVVLGVVVMIVTILLIIMMVYAKKRSKKPVFPANSVTTIQGGLEVLNGISHHKLSKAQLNKEIHANKTDASTTLDDMDNGYADIKPHNGFVSHTPNLLSKEPRQKTSSDTNIDQMTSSDHNTDEPKPSTRPGLQIVSGLKAQESWQGRDDNSIVSDKNGEYQDQNGNLDCDPTGLKPNGLGPKRKKSRKNKQSTRDQEENLYDGGEILGNVKFDSGFYTDSTKTRIKRSTRKSVVLPDPNDIKYWLTIQDD